MRGVAYQKHAVEESELTSREREILALLSHGRLQKEIAAQLHISYETVKKHVKNSYKKLQGRNRIDALRKAGLV